MSLDPRVLLVEEIPRQEPSALPPAATHPTPGAAVGVTSGSQTWTLGPYGYDGAGNIKSIGTDAFRYDAFGRVTRGTAGAGHEQTYTYDRFGNLLTITTDGDTANRRNLGVDPLTNRITLNTGSYNAFGEYDATGNMVKYLTDTFAYDAVGMIREAVADGKHRLFLYTPSDERIASIAMISNAEVSSEWTLRDPSGKVLRRFTKTGSGAGTWSWNQDYIYRDGQLLAAETPGRRLHFHLDHLGTPRLITDGTGVKVALHTYYPFGKEATDTDQDGEKLKFTGHERDNRYVDYLHARFYSGSLGRFFSVDRIDGVATSPQTWNRYTYVRNNPLAYVDPDGNYLMWAAGLSKGDQTFLRNSLVQLARRPSGRALIQKLGADSRAVIIGTGSLNSSRDMAAARRGQTVQLRFGENTFRNARDGSTTVTLDRAVIQQFGSRPGTPDRGGITTMGHELFHADKALNDSAQRWRSGDEPTSATGPAEQFGQSVFGESVDMTASAARVEVTLAFIPTFFRFFTGLNDPFQPQGAIIDGVWVSFAAWRP